MGYLRPFTVMVAIVALAFCGLAWAQEDQPTELPPPEAKPLWDYVTVASPYADWQPLPGAADLGPVQEPHGELGRTFVNPVAAQAIEVGQAILPAGSIIVQEGLNASRDKVLSISVMYKSAGYDPAGGDWFWLMTSPEVAAADRFLAQGKVASCLACHGAERANDYIMGVRLGR